MSLYTVPKRDFGSFHASNVQELLSSTEEDYLPPPIPINLPTFANVDQSCGGFSFGKRTRKEFFLLEESCCFLNHGAFGGALKQALDAVSKWQAYTEKQPLRFYDRELFPLLVHVCRRLANFVGCDARDLVLVNNATFGTNSVLSSLPLGPDSVILTFNITYGAVKKLVHHICTKTGAHNREAVVQFPLSGRSQILELLEDQLASGDVYLVIIDHIPSNTPFVMPVEEMVTICRKSNVKVFIDGAHALGSLPLNLRSINPDYYVSNAHKWLCCPKGAAFLYVRRELQSEVRPAVVSHGLGSGFNSEFVWSGLHDYSAMLSLHTVLDFWQSVGSTNIQEYMHNLARTGADLLMKSWHTEPAAPADMFATMVLVQLPEKIHSMFADIDYSAAEFIQNSLYHNYSIEVPIKCVQGTLYVRISAHIYNELSDYEKLAKAVNMICEEKGNKLL